MTRRFKKKEEKKLDRLIFRDQKLIYKNKCLNIITNYISDDDVPFDSMLCSSCPTKTVLLLSGYSTCLFYLILIDDGRFLLSTSTYLLHSTCLDHDRPSFIVYIISIHFFLANRSRIPTNYSIDNNQKLIGEENNRNNAKAKAIDDRLCNMFDIEGRFKKIFPLRPIFPLFAKTERRRIQGERRQKAGGRENGARHT